MFYFAVSCYVIYPIDSAQYVNHRAIDQTLFHICHTRYLAFLASKSYLADFNFWFFYVMCFLLTVTFSWATVWKFELLAIYGEWEECNTHLSLKALVALGCFLLMIIHRQWAEKIVSLLHGRYGSELY